MLRRNDDDSLEPVHHHPWFFDPESLAGGLLSYLRRALRHAEGGDAGWTADDLGIVVAQGRGSAAAANTVGEGLLPQMASAHQAFLDGHARFLDVGVGIGVVARRLCEMFPGVRAVGLDVLEPVLDVARASCRAASCPPDRAAAAVGRRPARRRGVRPRVAAAGVHPAGALAPGLAAVFRALRRDRWLVAAVEAAPVGADDFTRAVYAHRAHLSGGGPITIDEVRDLLAAAGFDRVTDQDHAGQVVMLAHRP